MLARRASSTPLIPILVLSLCPAAVDAQFVEPDVDVLFVLEGEMPGDQLGIEVVALADYTGDGVNEFLAAASHNDEGAPNAGKVYVVDGRCGDVIRAHVGTRANQFLRTLCDAGDVDGDGVLDYMFGSSDDEVFIHSGADGTLIRMHTGLANEQFGFRICGAGDMDGDGHGEVLIGAWSNDTSGSNRGRAYMFSGATGALMRTHQGYTTNAWFGHTVGLIGDIDGDGMNDYTVGAPGPYSTSTRGRSYVFSGATGLLILPVLSPYATGLAFGSWDPSFGLGDVNDDGVPEFTCTDISDFSNGSETGRLYVYDGATRSVLYTIQGQSGFTGMGTSPHNPASALGDVTGDGSPDLLIASWRGPAGATDGGQVHIVDGKDGTFLRNITSNTPFAYFGGCIASAGDVDGNGTTDIIAGANGHDGNRGRVYVISGHDHAPALSGDATGDGVVDVSDLVAVITAWGPCPGCPAAACDADIDNDCDVDVDDLVLVLVNWS